jgi:hypothetical protein
MNAGYNEQKVLSKVAKFANPYHAKRQIEMPELQDRTPQSSSFEP